jgi:uncharacterized DUF497 family protein
MDITYRLQGVTFEWDADKARLNLEKHGVTFEEAAEAFFDPFCQGGDASSGSERRDFLLGYSLAQRLLLVVHTDRVNRTRIISARQATRAERKQYEQS